MSRKCRQLFYTNKVIIYSVWWRNREQREIAEWQVYLKLKLQAWLCKWLWTDLSRADRTSRIAQSHMSIIRTDCFCSKETVKVIYLCRRCGELEPVLSVKLESRTSVAKNRLSLEERKKSRNKKPNISRYIRVHPISSRSFDISEQNIQK